MVAISDPKRKSGISLIGDAPWGTHCCQFYRTKQDLIDILVPYFQAGLENNEFCMWVTSEPLPAEEARAELQKAVKDLALYDKKGQIEILDFSQWYTRTGKFDAGKVLQGWVDKEQQARKNGFEGLRLSGNTFWLEPKDWKSFSDYEATVNDVIHNYSMFALCAYSLDHCDANQILDVFSTHQFALINRNGNWTTLESTDHKKSKKELRSQVKELVASQAALEKSERRHRLLAENVSDVIWTTDMNLKFTYISPSNKRLTGFSVKEAMSRSLKEILAPASFEEAMRVYSEEMALESSGRADPARSRRLELEQRCKDGSTVAIEVKTTFLRDDQGRPVGILGVTRDITERKSLEVQLLQAQKMEAVGRLAGGVAHDFNNLLTLILSYCGMALEILPEGHPVEPRLKAIKEAGELAAKLTSQLLAFSRKQILQPKVLSLNEVVDGVVKMLRRMIGEDIEILLHLEGDLGRVKADPVKVEQVLMNLAVNSRDAMPKGGKLTFETANAELGEAYTRSHPDVRPGSYVMLAVSDTGCGMDEATQAHIFEPFFTTKEKGKGTGLGLSTVYGYVKQSGGSLFVYSEPGKGTTFKIYLPRTEEGPEPQRAGAGPRELPQGAETVLVAEDDDKVRDLVYEILQYSGFAVLEARRGEDALRLAGEHAGPIHLLITDVVMPGMDGRDLAESLTALRPETRVLYISGFMDEAVVRHGVLEPGLAFLEKPFVPEALLRKVREVLKAPPSSLALTAKAKP